VDVDGGATGVATAIDVKGFLTNEEDPSNVFFGTNDGEKAFTDASLAQNIAKTAAVYFMLACFSCDEKKMNKLVAHQQLSKKAVLFDGTERMALQGDES